MKRSRLGKGDPSWNLILGLNYLRKFVRMALLFRTIPPSNLIVEFSQV